MPDTHPIPNEMLTRPPGFLTLFFDSLIATCVAWVIPNGINLVALWLGYPPVLPNNILVSVLAFFTTILFLYGFQITRWVGKAVEDQCTRTMCQVREVLRSESATILRDTTLHQILDAFSTGGATAASCSQLLRQWVAVIDDTPTFLHPAMYATSEWHTDEWRRSIASLQGGGLELSLDRQMQLIRAFMKNATHYVLTDPTIYVDVNRDWTPTWISLLQWASTLDTLCKEYVIVAVPGDTRNPDPNKLNQMRSMSRFLESRNFVVRYCDPQHILDSDPDTSCLENVYHFFNDQIAISMPVTAQFTGSKRIVTRVTDLNDDMRRFRYNLNRFQKSVSELRLRQQRHEGA